MPQTEQTHILYRVLPAHLHPHIGEFLTLMESMTSRALPEVEVNRRIAAPHLRELVHELVHVPAHEQEQMGLSFERRDHQLVLTAIGRDQVNIGHSAGPVSQNNQPINNPASNLGMQGTFYGPVTQPVQLVVPEPPPITACTGVITEQHIATLKHLVAGQTWQQQMVITCYRRCLPRHRPSILFASDPQRAIADAIDDLKRVVGGSTAPLLEFAEHLAGRAEHPDQIRHWVNETSCAIGWDQQRLAGLRDGVMHSPALPPPTNPHLFLAIIPSHTRPGEFRMQTWLWTDEYQRVVSASDATYPASQVEQAAIGELTRGLREVKQSGELMTAIHDLTIALILPRPMLLAYVEQWEVDMGYPRPRPVGRTFPVVARSLERLINHELQAARWPSASHQIDAATVVWLHDLRQYDFDDLIDKLERAWCLAFTVIPEYDPDDDGDPLTLAVYTGTPVALWPRHARHEAATIQRTCEAKIARHLADRDLPQQMKQLRNHQDMEVKEIWRDMALLWDDPERQPRITRPKLQAPR